MRRMLAASALALLLVGCATPFPSGGPVSQSPASTQAVAAVATPSATVPPTTCHDDPPSWWAQMTTTAPDATTTPVVVTLTCERAVAAAWTAVSNGAAVVSAEFTMGDHCLPETACPPSQPNTGLVVFHLRDGRGFYVVVQSDASGSATVAGVWGLWPTPPPS